MQTLLRITECSVVVINGSFTSEAQVIFLSTHCKNLVDIQQVKPRKLWWVLND